MTNFFELSEGFHNSIKSAWNVILAPESDEAFTPRNPTILGVPSADADPVLNSVLRAPRGIETLPDDVGAPIRRVEDDTFTDPVLRPMMFVTCPILPAANERAPEDVLPPGISDEDVTTPAPSPNILAALMTELAWKTTGADVVTVPKSNDVLPIVPAATLERLRTCGKSLGWMNTVALVLATVVRDAGIMVVLVTVPEFRSEIITSAISVGSPGNHLIGIGDGRRIVQEVGRLPQASCFHRRHSCSARPHFGLGVIPHFERGCDK
jgi:hypothetical protein